MFHHSPIRGNVNAARNENETSIHVEDVIANSEHNPLDPSNAIDINTLNDRLRNGHRDAFDDAWKATPYGGLLHAVKEHDNKEVRLLLEAEQHYQNYSGQQHVLNSLFRYALRRFRGEYATERQEQILKMFLQSGAKSSGNKRFAELMIARNLAIHCQDAKVAKIQGGAYFRGHAKYPLDARLPLDINILIIGLDGSGGGFNMKGKATVKKIQAFFEFGWRYWRFWPTDEKKDHENSRLTEENILKAIHQLFPLKLQNLCRLVILFHLPLGLVKRRDAIDKLEMLPPCLKDYLKLEN